MFFKKNQNFKIISQFAEPRIFYTIHYLIFVVKRRVRLVEFRKEDKRLKC